jgi:maleate cis-trans isomerase
VKTMQVGMLIPWVNTAMEEEIPSLVDSEIGLHWSRLRPAILPRNGHDTSYLRRMLLCMPEALSRFNGMDLHAIVLGCTSVSFAHTCSDVAIPDEYRAATLIMAFDAVIRQVKRLKAERVMLFAPYDKRTIDAEATLMVSQGINVVKRVVLTYESEIRFISTEQVYDAFLREYVDCDAVLFSCTALYTLELISNIQQEQPELRASLLSSNTAIARTLNEFVDQVRGQEGV